MAQLVSFLIYYKLYAFILSPPPPPPPPPPRCWKDNVNGLVL